MEIGVAAAASQLGVSAGRVRQLVAAGSIPARKVSGSLLIEESALHRSAPVSRPFSPRIAWAFLDLLDGRRPPAIGPSEMQRLRERRLRLLNSEDPAELMRSWLNKRAPIRRYRVSPSDLSDLGLDPRLLASGISDPRSGMSSGAEVEAYVPPGDLDAVVAEYLLSQSSSRPNVILRPAMEPFAASRRIGGPGLALVLADLADHHGPREDGQIRRLLAERLR